MEKSDLFFVHGDVHRFRIIPIPLKPSTIICKITNNFVTPFLPLCERHKLMTPDINTNDNVFFYKYFNQTQQT